MLAYTGESKEETPEKCDQQLWQRFCEDCRTAELLQKENYFHADCEVLYATGALLWFETSTHSKLLTFRMWFSTLRILRATFSIGYTAVKSIHELILQLFLKVLSSYSYFMYFFPASNPFAVYPSISSIHYYTFSLSPSLLYFLFLPLSHTFQSDCSLFFLKGSRSSNKIVQDISSIAERKHQSNKHIQIFFFSQFLFCRNNFNIAMFLPS